MKIQGRIIQIIPPDRQDKYVCQGDFDFIEGKYFLYLSAIDVPKSRTGRMFFKVRHARTWKKYFMYVAADSCPYARGAIVEFDVEQYMKPTMLYITK